MKFFEAFDDSITIKKDGINLIFYSSKIRHTDRKILCIDQEKNVWRFKSPDRGSKTYRLVPYNPHTRSKHYHLFKNGSIKEIVLTKEQIKFFKNKIH